MAQAVSHLGGLDCLVNSAGITPRTLPPEADFEERWDAVMAVNAKGVFLMSHAALTVMRPAGRGAIVNLVSIMGIVAYPTSLPFSDGFTAYPHSKGAVVQMTKEMGVRFASEGVRINAVAPAFVYTPLTANVISDPVTYAEMRRLHPMGRMGQPEEIAAVVAFLGLRRRLLRHRERLAGGWRVHSAIARNRVWQLEGRSPCQQHLRTV